MNEALFSSKNMNWCTPQEFFDELNAEFHFALDAAATDKSAKCPKYYTPETDGLKQPWIAGGGGSVFCNPPYGKQIGEWVRKAYEEAQRGTGREQRRIKRSPIRQIPRYRENGFNGRY